jgi:VanZ family protein
VKRLLLLVIALIAYGSLYPWHFVWSRNTHGAWGALLATWPSHVDRFVLRDITINVLLYIPLGLAAFLAAAHRHSRLVAGTSALLLGAALSTSMEIIQIYVPGRISSLLDIETNIAGTLVGISAALVLQTRIEALLLRPRRLARSAALLLGAWAVFQFYPFFPALSQAKLRHSLASLASGRLSLDGVWADAAEWFAAALALGAVTVRMRWWWLAGALMALAARMLIATRDVTPDEIGGVALACLLLAVIPERFQLRAGVAAMALALVLRELEPFRFTAPAQAFSWVPFAPTFDSESQGAMVILARKAFDYGALVWLLRKWGVRYVWAGLLVAAGLFAFELLQVYQPGRTPEITDAVVAVLMTAALWLSDDPSRQFKGKPRSTDS